MAKATRKTKGRTKPAAKRRAKPAAKARPRPAAKAKPKARSRAASRARPKSAPPARAAKKRATAKVVFDRVLKPDEYFGLKLARGQTLSIVDLEGQQVMEMALLSAADPGDHLSVMWTNFLNKTWKPTTGTTLYSIRCNPMVDIVEDTVGVHSTFGGFCNEHINRTHYGVPHTRNCYDNVANALGDFGISKKHIPEAAGFAAFMNITCEEGGDYHVCPAASRPGDHIDLEARMDLLVGLSCCPQVLNAANNFEPTPMRVVVYEATRPAARPRARSR